jgi:hypothetical protein
MPMQKMSGEGQDYVKNLKTRGKDSRVYHSHQFVGLEIAMLLGDLEHKSLYIKFAKQHNPERLLALAKSVLEKRDVKNRGAYFMTLVHGLTSTNSESSANKRIKKDENAHS